MAVERPMEERVVTVESDRQFHRSDFCPAAGFYRENGADGDVRAHPPAGRKREPG